MWKLFFHDRTTFSSNDGPWEKAPYVGVMGLAYVDDWVGWSRRHNDFYVVAPWMGGEPMAVDHWGLTDVLVEAGRMLPSQRVVEFPMEQLGRWGVKFGRSIPDDEWNEVKAWMNSDSELPRKSARYPYERP